MDNNQLELKTELEKFFVYSYLNVGMVSDMVEGHANNLLLMAINKAYGDATQQNAFNGLFKKNIINIGKLKESSETNKVTSSEYLYDKISKYGKSINFATWHKEVCERLVNDYNKIHDENNKNFFTYGNAQKWLNMTLKYLWLLNRLPNDMDEKALHAPIDSYILQKLKKLEIEGVTGSGETFYYKKKCWSNIDKYNEYMELQEKIRKFAKADGKSVIEWENEAWIEMSVARKTPNIKSKRSNV
ncbi:MAG: hypothetical protein J6L61_11025 [Ruminiclostridium sp.]|nr:hypothetical protein [Ruminiclostridium sp.]